MSWSGARGKNGQAQGAYHGHSRGPKRLLFNALNQAVKRFDEARQRLAGNQCGKKPAYSVRRLSAACLRSLRDSRRSRLEATGNEMARIVFQDGDDFTVISPA